MFHHKHSSIMLILGMLLLFFVVFISWINDLFIFLFNNLLFLFVKSMHSTAPKQIFIFVTYVKGGLHKFHEAVIFYNYEEL